MPVARPALVALLLGFALLASPAGLLQFQEPTECRNAVTPAESVEIDGSEPVFQYDELSPDAKHAFDEAQGAGQSVAVYGDRCPDEFTYSASQERYVIVEGDSRYLLRTYAGDLIPEVAIAAGLLGMFGLVLLGIGLGTYDDPDAAFPLWAGGVGVLTLVAVSVTAILGQYVFTAIGGAAVATAGTLVGAGIALRPRRALALGGALSVLPVAVAVPLAGVSLWFLLPALLPLLLVGGGIGVGRLLAAGRKSRA